MWLKNSCWTNKTHFRCICIENSFKWTWAKKKGWLYSSLQSSVQLWVYWHKWVSAWRTWLICAKCHLVIQRRIWNRIRELFFLCEQNLFCLLLLEKEGNQTWRRRNTFQRHHSTRPHCTLLPKKLFDCDSIEDEIRDFPTGWWQRVSCVQSLVIISQLHRGNCLRAKTGRLIGVMIRYFTPKVGYLLCGQILKWLLNIVWSNAEMVTYSVVKYSNGTYCGLSQRLSCARHNYSAPGLHLFPVKMYFEQKLAIWSMISDHIST